MDDIRFNSKWSAAVKDSFSIAKDTMKITNTKGSNGKAHSDTAILKGKNVKEGTTTSP